MEAGVLAESQGTGLGLVICNEIVALHGGRMGVRSSGIVGEGGLGKDFFRQISLVASY